LAWYEISIQAATDQAALQGTGDLQRGAIVVAGKWSDGLVSPEVDFKVLERATVPGRRRGICGR
jgi:hypothetical protein